MKTIRPVSLAAILAAAALAGVPEGQATFTAKCANCHGPDGAGKDAIAKMLKTSMKPLSSKEVQDKSDADFKKTITAGQGKMKPISGLTDAQVTDVIAFIRTLKK